MTAPATRVASTSRSSLRDTWPLARHDWLRLGVSLVCVIGMFSLLGWLYTDLLAPNAITRLDDDVAQWFVDQRSDTLTEAAHWGAMVAGTGVKIAITSVIALVMLAVWRRWNEPVLLALSLVFEATAFITITYIVQRPRPDVDRLLDSPVNSSFPSGHVAAATVYGALVIIVFWHTRRTWVRALAVCLWVLVIGVVAASRMYQGMHFLTDVTFGVLLGVVSLWICAGVIGRPREDARAELEDERAESPAPLEPEAVA